MEELLMKAGLSDPEAKTYLFLLEHGTTAPPVVAKGCGLTRTNAYKVLDSLQSLDLVTQSEQHKKIVYTAADPTALASLVAEQRNQVIAVERNIKTAMNQLRAKYRKSSRTGSVATANGNQAITAAYSDQAELRQDIHFIKSRADIPFLGYETMDRLRHLADGYGITRYGITPDAPEIADDEADNRTDLIRTRIKLAAYTAPVEWTVSGDELRIIKFEGDGESICIRDAAIADSFREIWQLAKQAGHTRRR